MRWETGGRTVAVLWGIARRIGSKQHTEFLCSSDLTFSPGISLKSMWCIHTVILTQPQLGRNPTLFYQWSDFHMINNQSEIVHNFPLHMLTSLSVRDIATTFRGLPPYIIYFVYLLPIDSQANEPILMKFGIGTSFTSMCVLKALTRERNPSYRKQIESIFA